ncbi:siderophore-interacting protein [Vibrio sp. WJH972]
MQRITLQGESLALFPSDCEGGYIKLLFNKKGLTDLSSMTEEERPVMRTYTIRHFSPAKRTIDIDFVRHTTPNVISGFGARWGMQAQIGDTIDIKGPGSIKEINTNVDWFFMVADMTALPALSAKISRLPSDAKGYAVIKVLEKEDIQTIAAPTGINIVWLIDGESLADIVTSLPWLNGGVSVWVACEFDSMRQLRTYFRNEKAVESDNIYISSYWKQGVTEDGHKEIKRKDASEHNG